MSARFPAWPFPGLGNSPAHFSQHLGKQKDQASDFIYSLVGSRTEKKGNRYSLWVVGFYYGLPGYHIALQKKKPKTLVTPNLIHFVLSRGKCSPAQEASGGGVVVPARGDQRKASGEWGAASAPLPEIRTHFQASAHTLCQGLCWLGLKHLEGEVTQHSLQPASQMHFTCLKPVII